MEVIMASKDILVKKYVVRLSLEERGALEALIRKGVSPAQRLLKARILLKADVSDAGEGWSDSRIIEALETSVSMVYRVRRQLVEEGFEVVLSRKQRAMPTVERIFDGEKEAKLIALACSAPPAGRARWTLRLLEEKVVELAIVDHASDSTIGRALKKNILQPHRRQQWVIPPDRNSAFVAAMEDVLCVYTRRRDPERPLVCMDEASKQLTAETRQPSAMKPGCPARFDYEYVLRQAQDEAQWHGQPVHDVRPARRLAPCQSHGPPHRRGLCPCPQRAGRYPLCRRQAHRSGAG
jgi:Homeodomain-like domain